MTRITIVGCGNWGSRIARKLAARGNVELLVVDECIDTARELADELGAAYAIEIPIEDDSEYVVIATPPDAHIASVYGILDRVVLPSRVRIEKPLAEDICTAERIVDELLTNDIAISCGFTLFYNAAYQYAMRLVRELGVYVHHIDAKRVGLPAAHNIDPVLDAGPHAACFAAYYQATLDLETFYSVDSKCRTATWHLSNGEQLLINELDGSVSWSGGVALMPTNDDALSKDLDAWLTGQHLGTPALALETQRILESHIA